MPFRKHKIHYTFKELIQKWEYEEKFPRSIEKLLNGNLFLYFVYPVIGPILINKISSYHIRKLFLYFQGNGLKVTEKIALVKGLTFFFNKALGEKIISINVFQETLFSYDVSISFSYFLLFTRQEKKKIQELNFLILYQEGNSIFHKPSFIQKQKQFSIRLYHYLSICVREKYQSKLENKISSRTFKDTFYEFLDLELNIGKEKPNNHLVFFYEYIIPAIGEKRICEIDEVDLFVFEIILRIRTLEETSISYYYSVFNQFFRYSIQNDYLEVNPFIYKQRLALSYLGNSSMNKKNKKGFSYLKNVPKKGKYALSKEELIKIVREIKGSKFEPIIGLMIIYGLRIGEVLGLKESSIDYKKGIITIESQVSSGKLMNHTKTKKKRKVLISSSGYYYLNLIEKRKDELQAKNPHYQNCDGLLITDSEGGLFPTTALVNYIKKIGIALHKPDLTFHHFRHTFISIASELNASLTKTKELIGHSSIETTMNTYIHSTETSYRITQNLVGRYFTNILNEYKMELNDYLLSENNSNNLSFETYVLNLMKDIKNKNEVQALMKAVKPYFNFLGNKKMMDIKRIDILKANKTFFDHGLKNKTINYRLWGLNNIFNRAIEEGLILKSPVSEIESLRRNVFYKPYYKDQEIKQILINTKYTKYGNAYALSLVTGIELKYLLALNVSDIHLETNTLNIDKYIERTKRSELCSHKINNKNKDVYINDLGIFYIQCELKNKKEKNELDEPLFINNNLERASIDNLRDVFKRYSKKLNIPYYPIDSLTYTFGVIAYVNDAPVSEVLKIIGKTKSKIIYENQNMFGKFKEKEININDYFDKLFSKM